MGPAHFLFILPVNQTPQTWLWVKKKNHLPSLVTLRPGAVVPPESCLDHLYASMSRDLEQVCRGKWFNFLFFKASVCE